MPTTLTYLSTTLTLPDTLSWPDEFAWVAVQERREYSITGALIIEVATRQAGRTITLEGGENRAWLQRSDVLQLQAWAQLQAASFTLALRGTNYTVKFDQVETPIEARPVFDEADPAATDFYVVRLRFIAL